MNLQYVRASILSVALCALGGAAAAQVPQADLEYMPAIARPAFAEGAGPMVRIDEAHHNYHTLQGRYAAFANLLRRDGYRMEASTAALTRQSLAGADVLVIANAEADQSSARISGKPASAFTVTEIQALHQWVTDGGSLLLIADHPPFSDSAVALARAFGFEFIPGLALSSPAPGQLDSIVTFGFGTGLMRTVLSSGRVAAEGVDSVVTFSGSAFEAPAPAIPVLVFGEGAKSVPMGTTGADFSAAGVALAGLNQGAMLKLGKGRVAVFGEAAMFTAQFSGPDREPVGMNAPQARQNYQFVLNLLHWLSGLDAAE